jgi:hypothetical protein
MPTQYGFYKVNKKRGGRRVVEENDYRPLREVIEVVKSRIPDVDDQNARREEQFKQDQQNAMNEGCFLLQNSYTPVEDVKLNLITDIGDVVYRTGEWNGRKFNEIVRDQPDWFKNLAKFVLHDGYVYKSWHRSMN